MPAIVRYGKKAVGVDAETGTVTLEGGEKLDADLVIGELEDLLYSWRHDNTRTEQ
jgi:hypothetical protein